MSFFDEVAARRSREIFKLVWKVNPGLVVWVIFRQFFLLPAFFIFLCWVCIHFLVKYW